MRQRGLRGKDNILGKAIKVHNGWPIELGGFDNARGKDNNRICVRPTLRLRDLSKKIYSPVQERLTDLTRVENIFVCRNIHRSKIFPTKQGEQMCNIIICSLSSIFF